MIILSKRMFQVSQDYDISDLGEDYIGISLSIPMIQSDKFI